MRPRFAFFYAAVVVFATLLWPCAATAQSAAPLQVHSAKPAQPLHKEFDGNSLVNWPDDEVPYIITPEERAAFRQLRNDEERESYIEQFWNRRDPTPDTIENEFKDEYYRRIVYANDQFAFDVPGWKTDRGRLYVTYGPPDAIGTSVPHKQSWRYRYLEGVGSDVVVDFLDVCGCDDYRFQIPTALKDRLLSAPPYHDREIESVLRQQPPGTLIQYIGPTKPPQVRFKDLEEVVTHRIRYNTLSIGSRFDFVHATELTDLVLAGISLNAKDLSWHERTDGSGRREAQVNIFARVTALTGRIVASFEGTLTPSVAPGDWPDAFYGQVYCRRTLPLPQGRYRIDIVVRDPNADHVGTLGTGIVAPGFASGQPALSTLMFADEVRPNSLKGVLDPLTIGSDAVDPRVRAPGAAVPTFRTSETIHTWLHAGSLAVDPKSHRHNLTVAYDIRTAAGKPVLNLSEERSSIGSQLVLEQALPMSKLAPGTYRMSITVTDHLTHNSSHAQADFAVEAP
jgi:GWxTD domain-containing protein